eukprot:TRINITY_DN21039_c0_g1_i1.p1 TRINITY_DN21039_c0_g1~~TRINITY_DN21039_c0_g1_i1.p1  ORF type:complete len:858 (+),score=242.15 TRINITY_DN21039_c0_g1_i1:249-2576(+)
MGTIIFTIDSEVPVASYRIMTAADFPALDPVQWTLDVGPSKEGPWQSLHKVAASANVVPPMRQEWSRLFLPVTPPPLPPPHIMLGVPEGSPPDVVDAAYRKLALKYHPSNDPAFSQRFCDLANAYHSLQQPTLPTATPLVDPYAVFHKALSFSWRLPGGVKDDFSAGNVTDLMIQPLRSASLYEFNKSFTDTGVKELNSYMTPRPPQSVRVILVRHGMGHHNDLMGAASHANRDALLNPVGITQARRLGKVLRSVGAFDSNTLIVVSPFRRALQTAAEALGETHATYQTIITPLAAEHTLHRSTVQQGDRGSTAAELRNCFSKEKYPEYDFSTVDKYCEEQGIKSGQWWHHGPPPRFAETYSSFTRRANTFRLWLGHQCFAKGVKTAVVFSHGGLLTSAFGRPTYGNCGFRVFDLHADGSAIRTVTGDPLPAPSQTSGLLNEDDWIELDKQEGKQLWVETVKRCNSKVDGHWVYRIEGDLDGTPMCCILRLSELRKLHDVVKKELGRDYKEYDLHSLFPAVHWRSGLAKGAEEWLQQLCVVMGDMGFPGCVKEVVLQLLSLNDIETPNASEEEEQQQHPVRWVPDCDASRCDYCKTVFTFLKRKHHCRKCGEVVCGKCSPFKMLLPEYRSEERVCKKCWNKSQSDFQYPSTVYVRSYSQPDVNGKYELIGSSINDMPCWESAEKWWLFAGKNGKWWISSSTSDFKKGAGVLCGQGLTPVEVTKWYATPKRGHRSSDCHNIDPGTSVAVEPFEQCEIESSDEWYDTAQDSQPTNSN